MSSYNGFSARKHQKAFGGRATHGLTGELALPRPLSRNKRPAWRQKGGEKKGRERKRRGKRREKEEGKREGGEQGKRRMPPTHTISLPAKKDAIDLPVSALFVQKPCDSYSSIARVVTYKYRDSEDDDDEDMAPKKHCTYRISSSGILLVCRNVSILSRLRFVQYFYTYIATNCLVIV